MAKVTVSGDAVVITSTMKLEDLRKIGKYRPESLILYGGEDGKEELFRIAVASKGSGSIGKFGAEFSPETHNGFATVTIIHGLTADNIAEQVADKFGAALVKLNELEETLPQVLTDIDAAREHILSCIEIF